MLQTSEVKHSHTAIRAAANKDVDTIGTKAYVEDLFVMRDQLSFRREGGDVPYCTSSVDARGYDQAW